MSDQRTCDYCQESIEDEPIQRGEQVYCCEACAFEASRSTDCGGRSDTNIAQPTIEQA